MHYEGPYKNRIWSLNCFNIWRSYIFCLCWFWPKCANAQKSLYLTGRFLAVKHICMDGFSKEREDGFRDWYLDLSENRDEIVEWFALRFQSRNVLQALSKLFSPLKRKNYVKSTYLLFDYTASSIHEIFSREGRFLVFL